MMILGQRVRLRPIRRDDLPFLRAWFADPETMRFWGQPVPLVTDEYFERELTERFARFDHAGYFMIETNEGRPIGRIEYEQLDMRSRSAEVMILIGAPEARGHGYGSDAMISLLRYLYHERNLHRVALSVIAWNARAIRSYEKVGFVVEGMLRDDLFFEGRFHDQVVLPILRREFDARWPREP